MFPLHASQLFTKQQNLDLSKLKAFEDKKINVTEKLNFLFERVENIVRKGENADHKHFLLFPLCF